MFWFNPYEDINTNDICANIETESNSKESTLWLEIPDCSTQGNYYNCPENAEATHNCWADPGEFGYVYYETLGYTTSNYIIYHPEEVLLSNCPGVTSGSKSL